MKTQMNMCDRIKYHCEALGVSAVCPYECRCADGGTIMFAAYLRQFGSKRGLLIGEVNAPEFAISERHRLAAKNINIPASFVNPASIVTQSEFIDALRDWGYFGDDDSVPAFIAA